MSTKNILVIGLGQIGYSNAEYMTSLGLKVNGYDINKKTATIALENGVINGISESFKGFDYYLICVSTHNPMNIFEPDFTSLFETARKLSKEANDDALVAIESTITRGISNKVYEIVGDRMHVAHTPHRYYVNEKAEHGVRQLRVVGGCDSCCLAKAKEFYNNVLKVPLYSVSQIDIAELTKIVENSYRFMEIAFAEELKMLCDSIGLRFDELRDAVNTKWNIKILEARDGIGGHCLPKDTEMFLNLSKDILKSSIVESARDVDERYRLRLRYNKNMASELKKTIQSSSIKQS